MPLQPLQRLCVGAFSALGGAVSRLQSWIRARPGLAAWVYPGRDAGYRKYNGWYFSQFSEQERMLADAPRMNFYRAAIERHIRPGDRVVDLGTGTGILAALASRNGAAKVYAIDHSSILGHAKKLAGHNRLENVEFIAAHSKEFSLDEPVDAIVHEQMGDWLFNEAMVANVLDLRDRLLKPGGLILPGRFDLFCEPVKLRDERHVPFIWELNVHGYDYSILEWSRPQEPGYYHQRGCDTGLVERFLGDPAPVLSFDLHTLREAELPREVRYSRTVAKAGRLDGYAVYFMARVDGDLSLGSGPLDPGRAPHWGFQILRCGREQFEAGDAIDITLSAERWPDPDTWRWRHERRRPPP